ncbi:hypothetical protein MKK84_28340 [Methylobacterium sp. E-065]|uniref:DUF6894 family protein n=1 Tax=Methylobacterium sp. E-065 TaxID=2836583 RepID=UPI001FBB3DF2|nr:hypothetical protein [Methylobacterium sp. E-065]MCJ2021280.1 hypothetical protein [Methylobacterium sp. E-065]
MPRFFFDITNGVSTIDDTGTEFLNAHAARDAAIRTLPDIARDEIGTRGSHMVSVQMRDDFGRYLFTASLNLSARWLVETT